jgi:hypothetical protein
MVFSFNWRETRGKKHLAFYFLSAIAAVAAIPTNLLAFAAITFLPPTEVKPNKLKEIPYALYALLRERLPLGLLPLLAFAAFYGPLWRSLFSALKHNNGWLSPASASLHLYAGFAVAFFPLLLLAGANLAKNHIAKRGNPPNEKNAMNALLAIFAVILPTLVICSRTPAPFPRVFICFWPIWLYLTGKAITRKRRGRGESSMLNVQCSIHNDGGTLADSLSSVGFASSPMKFAILAATVILWGVLTALFASELSETFTKKYSQDDFFKPYFMRRSFNPLDTVNAIIKLTGKKRGRVFLSQNCDFPSIIFYGKLKGLPDDFWLFDSPGKKASPFSEKTGSVYIVARGDSDLLLISQRFGIKQAATPILTTATMDILCPFQRIYETRPTKR